MIQGWDKYILEIYPELEPEEAVRTAEKYEQYLRLILRIHERILAENAQPVRVVSRDGPLTNNSNRPSLQEDAKVIPSKS